MKEFAVYTLLRLLLLAATFGIIAGIWVLAAGSFPVVPVALLAFIVSGIASYFVLNRPRVAFASKVERRANTTLERMRSKEDVD